MIRPCGNRAGDGHDLRQLQRLAALSLAEKLEWLEDAHRLVRHLRLNATAEPTSLPEKG